MHTHRFTFHYKMWFKIICFVSTAFQVGPAERKAGRSAPRPRSAGPRSPGPARARRPRAGGGRSFPGPGPWASCGSGPRRRFPDEAEPASEGAKRGAEPRKRRHVPRGARAGGQAAPPRAPGPGTTAPGREHARGRRDVRDPRTAWPPARFWGLGAP